MCFLNQLSKGFRLHADVMHLLLWLMYGPQNSDTQAQAALSSLLLLSPAFLDPIPTGVDLPFWG